MAELTHAFPDFLARLDPQAREATMRLYLRELADIPAEILAVAVRDVIRTSDHFPRVKAIREAAALRTLALPTESEALAQVAARIAWGRQPEQDRGAPPVLHPLVGEALDHVGGYHAFRVADEPGVVRGQFLRLYKDLRSGALRDANVGPALPPPEPPRAIEA